MGNSFIIQPTESYPACHYVVKNPSTWNPASTSAAHLDGCVTLAAGERVLCPSGASVGIYIASSATVCVADPGFVVREGYTVRCVRSAGGPVYRQTAASGAPVFVPWRQHLAITEVGAVGDDTLDSSAAFNRSWSAAVAGDHQFTVPAGVYRVNPDVTIPAAVYAGLHPLRVQGVGSSTLRCTAYFAAADWSGAVGSGSTIRDTSTAAGAFWSWPAGSKLFVDGFFHDGVQYIGSGTVGRHWLDFRSTNLSVRTSIARTVVCNYDIGIALGVAISTVVSESAIIGCRVGISDIGYQSNRVVMRDSWIQSCDVGLDIGDGIFFTMEGVNIIQGCGIGARIKPSISNTEGAGPFAINNVHFEPVDHWGGHDVIIDSSESNIREVSFSGTRGSGSFEITGSHLLNVSFGLGNNVRGWLVAIPPFCTATIWDTSVLGPIIDYGAGTKYVQNTAIDKFLGWYDADIGVTGTTSVTAWESSKNATLDLVGSGGTSVALVTWGSGSAMRIVQGGSLLATSGLTGFDGVGAQWFAAMQFKATVAGTPNIWQLRTASNRGYYLLFNAIGATHFQLRLEYYTGSSSVYANSATLDMTTEHTAAWGFAEGKMWLSVDGTQTAVETTQSDDTDLTCVSMGFRDIPAGTTLDIRRWMIDARSPQLIDKPGCQNWAAQLCRFMALLA